MALVTPDEAGTYRQLSHRLRISGRREGRVSERRRDERSGRFLDSDEEPTLITFAVGEPVDIPFLLQIGAIAPLPGAQRRRAPKHGKGR